MTLYYGTSLYNSKELQLLAGEYIRHLPTDVNVLVSYGSSGNSIASAMLSLSETELHHIHIRRNEVAHTKTKVGLVEVEKDDILAIVDDFIDTGETMDKILWKLKELSINNKVYIIIHEAPFSPFLSTEEIKKRYNNIIVIKDDL